MTALPGITHLAAGNGRSFLVLRDHVTFKVAGHQTEGIYTIFEVAVPPLTGPLDLHTHPPQETCYILEGEFEFSGLGADGPYTIRAMPGSIVHIPGGTPHNYRNAGAAAGRFLIITAPLGMEQFFAELGTPVEEGACPPPDDNPLDLARVMAICRKHQVEFLPSNTG
jgi:quercetin dioxygenase-like cupin family protein